jgi:hypothetical protein
LRKYRFAGSARNDELDADRDGAGVSYTLTRSQPPGRAGRARRIDAPLHTQIAWPVSANPLTFVWQSESAHLEARATKEHDHGCN